ncbi:MAG TPA: MFS transporter [Gammaproteobacteria bacterium]|nr:MFS transporter [Gammaproteobacteria bacterium]
MLDYDRKKALAWMFYDWANSAFATVVLVGFFPVFYKQVLAVDLGNTVSTFYLGLANSLSGFAIIVLGPILGVMADQTGKQKLFLLIFTLIGVAGTGGLFFLAEDSWMFGLACFLIAGIGFMGSMVFYDAMLVGIVPAAYYERISSGGYALGYLGGGLLFAFCILMSLHPQWFGFPGALDAVRWSFLLTALWWAAFSIPLLSTHIEAAAHRPVTGNILASSFKQLQATLGHIRDNPLVFKFLLAYWFYIDGIDTIIRMATDYGLSVGIDSNDLITALLITQFVGFPATIFYGRLGERIGSKSGILLALAVYLVLCVWAYFMDTAVEFYVLAAVVGLVQGGVQALSRAVYASLVPPERSTEFFGFYNMLGKTAVLLGPVLMGTIGAVTGNSRYSVLAIIILLAIGGWVLLKLHLPRRTS